MAKPGGHALRKDGEGLAALQYPMNGLCGRACAATVPRILLIKRQIGVY